MVMLTWAVGLGCVLAQMCDEDSGWRVWREAKVAACFNGVPTRAVHVLLARSARSGRALSESARLITSLIGTVMPYDEIGHVCVWCMVLCIVLRVPGVGALDILRPTVKRPTVLARRGAS